MYHARDIKITSYLRKAKELLFRFEEMEIKQILREANHHTHALANLSSVDQTEEPKMILFVYLKWPAIRKTDKQEISELSH